MWAVKLMEYKLKKRRIVEIIPRMTRKSRSFMRLFSHIYHYCTEECAHK